MAEQARCKDCRTRFILNENYNRVPIKSGRLTCPYCGKKLTATTRNCKDETRLYVIPDED